MDTRIFTVHVRIDDQRTSHRSQLGEPVALLLGLWSGNSRQIVGTTDLRRRIIGEQPREHRVQAMGGRQTWRGVLVIIAALLLIDTVPGHADHGGYGYTGHAYRSHGHRGFR
jgi:hypothetical protein